MLTFNLKNAKCHDPDMAVVVAVYISSSGCQVPNYFRFSWGLRVFGVNLVPAMMQNVTLNYRKSWLQAYIHIDELLNKNICASSIHRYRCRYRRNA